MPCTQWTAEPKGVENAYTDRRQSRHDTAKKKEGLVKPSPSGSQTTHEPVRLGVEGNIYGEYVRRSIRNFITGGLINVYDVRCRIDTFFMLVTTTLMNHQYYQNVLDLGCQNLNFPR